MANLRWTVVVLVVAALLPGCGDESEPGSKPGVDRPAVPSPVPVSGDPAATNGTSADGPAGRVEGTTDGGVGDTADTDGVRGPAGQGGEPPGRQESDTGARADEGGARASTGAAPRAPRDDTGGTESNPAIPATGLVVVVGESQWWQGGFNGELTVRNNDAPTVKGWKVQCTFDSFEVEHAWNAVWSQSDGVNTFESYDWNAELLPGKEAKAGFTASGVLEAKTVAQCTLNGGPVSAVPAPMEPSKPGGGSPAPEVPEVAPPGVPANQVGYLPQAQKRATVPTDAEQPLDWVVRAPDGSVAAAGKTSVFGEDPASHKAVHVLDFSSVQAAGSGYVIEVGELKSHPFDIDDGLYSQMKYDALAYFFHNRSGMAIELPWAQGEPWVRPAGHPGDAAVPCYPNTGCDYTLDVSGGWYDAGDHGKYVVNGGIAVWTLTNLWERLGALGKTQAALGDGTLMIPESANGIPDILDETRWQMRFMLGMQVPADHEKAGMAHHKIHDEQWTPLATAPHEDKMKRWLYPPSTAATLNLAATAAQAARVWSGPDPEFSAQCLQAAQSAWVAAQAFPEEYATQQFTGGGPYDDNDVSDEQYWAAVELWVTTGQAQYLEAAQASPHWLEVPVVLEKEGAGPMSWKVVSGLGTITLALLGSGLPPGDKAQARAAVVAAADAFRAIQAEQGYGTPYWNALDGKYPWGSNSFVLNQLLIMALSHDFTGDPSYRHGVEEGMDYLLGRNPKGQCYVTGYGEAPLLNPHHRFWAWQADTTYPKAPPGAISGGPNSGLQDPWVQSHGLSGCAPARCFLDHIESWSTNEITINWNAPFAWVAAWLDEVPPQQ